MCLSVSSSSEEGGGRDREGEESDREQKSLWCRNDRREEEGEREADEGEDEQRSTFCEKKEVCVTKTI